MKLIRKIHVLKNLSGRVCSWLGQIKLIGPTRKIRRQKSLQIIQKYRNTTSALPSLPDSHPLYSDWEEVGKDLQKVIDEVRKVRLPRENTK